MKKENFVKTMNLMKDFMYLTDELHDLGIEIVDSKLFSIPGQIFDQFVLSNFTDKGQDLVFWWMFEDVPKVLNVDGKEIDVENVNDFWNYIYNDTYVL